MRKQNRLVATLCGRLSAVLAMVVPLGMCGQLALAQGLSYQKATDDPLGGNPNISPSSAYVDPMTGGTATAVADDDLWGLRTDFGTQGAFPPAGEVWEVGMNEDAPELTQTVTGLMPSTEYDLYAAYWSDDDENWSIRTGVQSGDLSLYSFFGDHRSSPLEDSEGGLTAGAAIWSSPPPPTKEGTRFVEQRPDSNDPHMDPLVMLLGYAGRTMSNGSGEIDVYIDDLPLGGGPNRTWLDGVAYAPATDTPLALTATVDRDTGAITVNNDTSQSFDIGAYQVNSNTGLLATMEWSTIGGSWEVTDPDPMMETPPLATFLGEDGGGAVETIPSGGSLDFGNVWTQSPFEDIRIFATLGDGSLAVLAPDYVGTQYPFGDFDINGSIDLTDYEIMISNMHAEIMGDTAVELYGQGDFNTSGSVDFADFQLFRTAYIDANGQAAWAELGAAVPEPTGLALTILAGMGGLFIRRRRPVNSPISSTMHSHHDDQGSSMTQAMNSCLQPAADLARVVLVVAAIFIISICSSKHASAQMWDVNDDDVASPTQVDWIGVDTTNINDVTFTPVGTRSDGVDVAIAARDRGGYGGDFNDMWGDFIFASGSNAPGSGMDVLIEGLPPSTPYTATLWAFDADSGGDRSAFWNGSHILRSLTFDGDAANPTTLDEYSLQIPVMSNADGELLLEGRANVDGSNNDQHLVFLNGFQLDDLNALTLEVDTSTGNITVRNTLSSDVDINYYEILSPSGSLDDAGWEPLDSAEDDDPVGEGWDPAGGSSPTILSETNLQSMSTIGMGGGSLDLGAAFDTAGMQDLLFHYAAPDGGLALGLVDYISDGTIPGDFNMDGMVSAADYVVWRNGLGSEYTQDDYNDWVNNYGTGVPSSGAGATAVPEPAVASLLAVATLLVGACCRRRTA